MSEAKTPKPLPGLSGKGKDPRGLALGCWSFAGKDWGGQEKKDSRAAMAAAWDHGIRHWDTAIAYGDGEVEKLCGEFLKNKWDRVFLGTKGAGGKKPSSIIKALHASLRNLKTDFIDLYYLHYPKSGLDMRPHLELLEKEREKGVIGAIGVSNFTVSQLERVREAGRIDAHQTGYNLYWRIPEKDIIPHALENNIPVIAYSSLAMGILTGKFPPRPVFREGDIRPHTVYFDPAVWPALFHATEKLKELARSANRPLHHLALQWAARQPGVVSLLVGCRNAAQVEDNASALKNPLPSEVLREMTALSDSVRRVYPKETNPFRWYP